MKHPLVVVSCHLKKIVRIHLQEVKAIPVRTANKLVDLIETNGLSADTSLNERPTRSCQGIERESWSYKSFVNQGRRTKHELIMHMVLNSSKDVVLLVVVELMVWIIEV